MYFQKIKTEDLYLSPLEANKDIEEFTRLVNEDSDIAYHNAFYHKSLNSTKVASMIELWSKGECAFAIIEKESDKLIGNISLFNINNLARKGEIGIFIAKDYRSKGYGKQALDAFLNFVFAYLNLHKVEINVLGFNLKAKAFYESLGFKLAGVLREAYYFNNKYHDTYILDLLKKEYYN